MKQLGPYQLLRRLGVGGTAEVYLATGPNPRNVELLALKIILPHLAEDEQLRSMMIKEARTSALLHHPNVVEIFEVGELEGRPFLAMEFIAGWSVASLEKKVLSASELLPFSEACAIVYEAALGLEYAHQALGEDRRPLGLIHRDVSPQNIIIAQDGTVKVVDFGIAKATDSQATQTGGIKGKLPYMPPEQLRGKQIDRRLDVFALGAVLWELLCGRLLYPGRNEAEIIRQALNLPQPDARKVAPDLPAQLADLLARTVERDLDKRTPTMKVLADALTPWIPKDAKGKLAARIKKHFQPLPTTASEAVGLPPTPEEESSSPSRRSRTRGASAEELRAITPRRSSARVKTRLNLELPGDIELKVPKLKSTAAADYAPAPDAEEEELAKEPAPEAPRKKWGYVVFGVALLGVAGVVYATVTGKLSLNPPPAAAPDVASLDEKPKSQSLAEPKTPKRLTTTKGTLVIQCDVPAIVREYGEDLGKTPLTLTVAAGPHHLQVQTADRRNETLVDVNVPAGEQIIKYVALRAR